VRAGTVHLRASFCQSVRQGDYRYFLCSYCRGGGAGGGYALRRAVDWFRFLRVQFFKQINIYLKKTIDIRVEGKLIWKGLSAVITNAEGFCCLFMPFLGAVGRLRGTRPFPGLTAMHHLQECNFHTLLLT
jgi:hypothetical protein